MEAIGAVERGDWSSDMSGIFITEESDFIVHLHANSCASNELNGSANLQFSSSSFNMVSAIDEASYYASEPCSCSTDLPKFLHSGGLLMDDHRPFIFSVDLCLENMIRKHSCYQDRGDRLLSETNAYDLKRVEFESAILENSKKRSLSLKNVSKTRNKRPKKRPKLIRFSTNNEEDGNGDNNGQSTSNCNSEDDSNASQELIPKRHKSLDITGKTRATRGSATDPQSLCTRRRRERINQRLRTLQSLVPNGTKVDISTMLEEAVQYVKFLQLQIKLLSSNDQWMYAPIAYNGMDLGLNTMQSERRNRRWC